MSSSSFAFSVALTSISVRTPKPWSESAFRVISTASSKDARSVVDIASAMFASLRSLHRGYPWGYSVSSLPIRGHGRASIPLLVTTYGGFDLVGGDLLGAEKPVFALDAVDVAIHPVLGCAAGTGRRHDDPLARAPVRGCRHREMVRCLQGLDDAQRLIEVAAQAHRIVD